jgi:serine/threonine protein kinase
MFAAKILNPTYTNPSRLKRFRNEINFCAKNTHPNIIHIQESGITRKGDTFYIMPLYPTTLRTFLKNRIGPEVVLPLFCSILDGVEAAHLQNVWHRDIKPENILLSADGMTVVVADFGIAHFEDEDLLTAVETRNDERLANFQYAAPEQRMRNEKVDHRADIYALGLILNELFTKAVPQGTAFRSISQVVPDFAYLDEIVELMLRQNPADRPSSIDSIKKMLRSRGNEFASSQRLNHLKSQVIPETEVDDPFLSNPIQLIDVDYSEGAMVFELNRVPNPNWFLVFKNPMGDYNYYPGSEPRHFILTGKTMLVGFGTDADAKRMVLYTKSYIELANKRYAENLIAEHKRGLAEQQEFLRRQTQEEERRMKILAEVKNIV